MTTPTAKKLYLAQHEHAMSEKGLAVFNPHDKPIGELPVIYGFNNGGSSGWLNAVLLAEDGSELGSHSCSSEGYMRSDLGILEGTSPDRHETFKKHYPNGYRMEFVSSASVEGHKGLMSAFSKHDEKAKQSKENT